MTVTVFRKKITVKTDSLTEVTFNLSNGHTYVSVVLTDGNILSVRDITGEDLPFPEVFEDEDLLNDLYKAFCECGWGKIPFSPGELTFEKLVLMTRFVGYGRDFYGAVPCIDSLNVIDRSFSGISRRLHFASNVPQVFESSKLPDVKNVRDIIFTSPGLLFYIAELEAMWNLIKDVNYFCIFLKNDVIKTYGVLARIHVFPCLLDFFVDYVEKYDVDAFFKLMIKNQDSAMDYALLYSNLSEKRKKDERRYWNPRGFKPETDGIHFSIPVESHLGKDQAECVIDGFRFTLLRSSHEFEYAGYGLENGLWDYWRNPCGAVYVIMKGREYAGAVEVTGRCINRAVGMNYARIETDSPMGVALQKWAARHYYVI